MLPLGVALVTLGALCPAALDGAASTWTALLARAVDPRPEALGGAVRAAGAWAAVLVLRLGFVPLLAALVTALAVSRGLRAASSDTEVAPEHDAGGGAALAVTAVLLGLGAALGAVGEAGAGAGLWAVATVARRCGAVAAGLGAVELALRVAARRRAVAAARDDRATARRRQRESEGSPEVRAAVRGVMGSGVEEGGRHEAQGGLHEGVLAAGAAGAGPDAQHEPLSRG